MALSKTIVALPGRRKSVLSFHSASPGRCEDPPMREPPHGEKWEQKKIDAPQHACAGSPCSIAGRVWVREVGEDLQLLSCGTCGSFMD